MFYLIEKEVVGKREKERERKSKVLKKLLRHEAQSGGSRRRSNEHQPNLVFV